MINIRKCVFETNSSSTHSLNICTLEDWEAWKEGKLLYNPYEYEFIDNYMLSENAKQARLEEYYNTRIKKEFYKEFKDLTVEEKHKLMSRAVSEGFIFTNPSDNSDYYTFSAYWERNDDLEGFTEYYTTEHGDNIVIFGEYGYD